MVAMILAVAGAMRCCSSAARARVGHFAREAAMIGKLARGVARGTRGGGRGLFAMCVETEAQQIGDAQERLLCAPVAERHEFGAPVACELRGQAVGPLRV